VINITAIYGSPRRQGNTAALLTRAVAGARAAGAVVSEVVLRDLKMSPCLEIYGCKQAGRCVIQDDFHRVINDMMGSQGIMLASPIFFYTVSAQTKILMDRCQSLWVKKYWIDRVTHGEKHFARKGLFISVGATQGKKLFDGALLTVRYFFDALDTELYHSLLYRGFDQAGEIEKHPGLLEEAFEAGKKLAEALGAGPGIPVA
jgi:multimeric flavodoxin WrbA